MAASPNILWYQQNCSASVVLSAGVDCRRRRRAGLGDRPGRRREKVLTAFDICVASSSKRRVSSVTCGSVVLVAAMVGVSDASIIRSASCANYSRFRSPADGVRTMRTFGGRRWRNSSRRKVASMVLALSPSSCWICRRS